MNGDGAQVPADGSEPTSWNGRRVPPRPPLPVSAPDTEAARPIPSSPQSSATQTDEAGASKRGFIGMPPGVKADVDTVPAGERATDSVPAPIPSADDAAAGDAPTLTFADGSRVSLGTAILVGRDPTAQDAFPGATLVPVSDLARTVSKTHAAVQWSRGSVWVTDLNSTNGTRVVDARDRDTVCVPEVATPVRAGGGIRFGSVFASIVPGEHDGSG